MRITTLAEVQQQAAAYEQSRLAFWLKLAGIVTAGACFFLVAWLCRDSPKELTDTLKDLLKYLAGGGIGWGTKAAVSAAQSRKRLPAGTDREH